MHSGQGTGEVSVVIPTYNAAQWVCEAVDSVLGQTLRPKQIIVVDDGSKDDTRERLAGYAGRDGVEYVYQANAGVSEARNNGVSRATGEFVAFLDADDIWHPRKLEIQVGLMRGRAEVGMVGTERFDWPNEQPPAEVADAPPLVEVKWADLVVLNRFTTSSVMVRRSALEAVGPGVFDTALHGPEDYDLWLRLAEKFVVGNLDCKLTGYRSVAGSLGKQAQTMSKGMGLILRKLDERSAWDREGWMLRQKAYAYVDLSCAYMYGASGSGGVAIGKVLRSMVRYPMPFSPLEVRLKWARLRLLGVLILRATGMKAPEMEQR